MQSDKNGHGEPASASEVSSSDMTPFRYLDLAPELRQEILSAFLKDCKILAGANGKHTVIPAKLCLVSRTFTEDIEEAFKSWKAPERPVYRVLALRSGYGIRSGKLPHEVVTRSSEPYHKLAFDVVEFACFHWTAVRCMLGGQWDDSFDRRTQDGMLVTLPGSLLRTPNLTKLAETVMEGWRMFWRMLKDSGKVIPVVRVDLENRFHKVRCGANCCYLEPEWWTNSLGHLLLFQEEGLAHKVEIVGLRDEELEICKQEFEFAISEIEGVSIALENGVLSVVQPHEVV